eukprot:COSAG01_NODE_23591_length_809_cov_2.308451_1_plen_26_part_01
MLLVAVLAWGALPTVGTAGAAGATGP